MSMCRRSVPDMQRLSMFNMTIGYNELLKAFFIAHDPSQLNRQGNDVGPQYLPIIFAHSAIQKQKSIYYINKLEDENVYDRPIATTV